MEGRDGIDLPLSMSSLLCDVHSIDGFRLETLPRLCFGQYTLDEQDLAVEKLSQAFGLHRSLSFSSNVQSITVPLFPWMLWSLVWVVIPFCSSSLWGYGDFWRWRWTCCLMPQWPGSLATYFCGSSLGYHTFHWLLKPMYLSCAHHCVSSFGSRERDEVDLPWFRHWLLDFHYNFSSK